MSALDTLSEHDLAVVVKGLLSPLDDIGESWCLCVVCGLPAFEVRWAHNNTCWNTIRNNAEFNAPPEAQSSPQPHFHVSREVHRRWSKQWGNL